MKNTPPTHTHTHTHTQMNFVLQLISELQIKGKL